jgi:hypothetical protein
LWIEASLLGDVMVLDSLALVGLRLFSPTLGGGLNVAPLDVAIHFRIVIVCGEGVAGENSACRCIRPAGQGARRAGGVDARSDARPRSGVRMRGIRRCRRRGGAWWRSGGKRG